MIRSIIRITPAVLNKLLEAFLGAYDAFQMAMY
jgi:hypothetical protein